jgi:hypothetical protein
MPEKRACHNTVLSPRSRLEQRSMNVRQRSYHRKGFIIIDEFAAQKVSTGAKKQAV